LKPIAIFLILIFLKHYFPVRINPVPANPDVWGMLRFTIYFVVFSLLIHVTGGAPSGTQWNPLSYFGYSALFLFTILLPNKNSI
jgi:hypothetical protein